jgi:predicted DNA-binding transcriptional regulator AlpA
MQTPSLRTTRWLAQRLGLSVTTVERLRAARPRDLPPSILIGKSVRYDEATVEQWLTDRMTSSSAAGAQLGDQHVAS